MRRTLRRILGGIFVSASLYAGSVLATPGDGFTSSTIALGRFDEIDVHNKTLPAVFWQSRQKTQGLSDL